MSIRALYLAGHPTSTDLGSGADPRPELYDALVRAGCTIDSHESDLYVKLTPESSAILANYPDVSRSTFLSNVDSTIWIEVPFYYAPFWRAKTRRNK